MGRVRHRRVASAAAAVAALAVLTACIPPPSTGPGPTTTTTTAPPALPSWTFEVSEGTLAIRDFVADLSDTGLTIEGWIDSEGGIVIPADGISMSMVELFVGDEPAQLGVWIEAVAPGSGSFDDATGALGLDLDVRFRLRLLRTSVDTFGPNCRLGGASDPIELRPTGVAASDPTDGQLQLSDDSFVVTAAQDCVLMTWYVSEMFDVPSEPGDASLELTGTVTIGD